MKTLKYLLGFFLIFITLQSCQKYPIYKKYNISPDSVIQLIHQPENEQAGEFFPIPAFSGIDSLYWLKKASPMQIYSFQGNELNTFQRKMEWRELYHYFQSESGFPKPLFIPDKQSMITEESNACYKVDMTVNTKKELFAFSEILYDSDWVIWKEPLKSPSKKPISANVMNWSTGEKQRIRISSNLESIHYCADNLLISTRSTPDDELKWWVYQVTRKKLYAIKSYGETVQTSYLSDMVYWSSTEKAEWTAFSLSQRKVLNKIPFKVLPKGVITPFVREKQPAFWWRMDSVSTDMIHGAFTKENQLYLSRLSLPNACQAIEFIVDTPDNNSFWHQQTDHPKSFYQLTSIPDSQFALQEYSFLLNSSQGFGKVSFLTQKNEFIILSTQDRLYTFMLKGIPVSD